MWNTVLVIALIVCLLMGIRINVDIIDTYWTEKDTEKLVHVVGYDPSRGVIFCFENEETKYICPLIRFVIHFKQYDGPE